MAKLAAEDRKAIAAFLKSLAPRPNAVVESKTAKDDDTGHD
jgi:hypothetical protein